VGKAFAGYRQSGQLPPFDITNANLPPRDAFLPRGNALMLDFTWLLEIALTVFMTRLSWAPRGGSQLSVNLTKQACCIITFCDPPRWGVSRTYRFAAMADR
jgi:hypothetical protein